MFLPRSHITEKIRKNELAHMEFKNTETDPKLFDMNLYNNLDIF